MDDITKLFTEQINTAPPDVQKKREVKINRKFKRYKSRSANSTRHLSGDDSKYCNTRRESLKLPRRNTNLGMDRCVTE